MSRSRFPLAARIAAIGALVDGAVSAAISAEAGRKPSREALRKMGLPADAFDGVRVR